MDSKRDINKPSSNMLGLFMSVLVIFLVRDNCAFNIEGGFKGYGF